MDETLREKLALAALTEVYLMELDELSEQDRNDFLKVAEKFATALQSDAVLDLLTQAMMELLTAKEGSLLAHVPSSSYKQVIMGMVSALLDPENRGRWILLCHKDKV